MIEAFMKRPVGLYQMTWPRQPRISSVCHPTDNSRSEQQYNSPTRLWSNSASVQLDKDPTEQQSNRTVYRKTNKWFCERWVAINAFQYL